ncbi:uncharacterized protein LOC121739264 [Aricia agestis]|uniref:uncharacterized protein LOC121739264 n=1 Tax=Aricia agestis TaxID=91739 RepID=UPI001C207ED9|nr:uncharacterized protein LOC121739264 [Aricia agestis]
MKNKCCVPHCESKRNTVILHRFPKTEIGLNKWLQKCSKSGDFKKFSSEELNKMFVCHKHFEKRFVTAKLRLRQSAYPTLFSLEEINTGIPLAEEIDSENVTHLLDHNYYTQSVERQKHNDHAYCKQRRSPLRELLAQENTVLYINEPSTSSKPVTEGADDEFKHNNMLTETTVPHSTTLKVSRKPYINKKKLNPVSLKLLAEYKKAKRKLNFLTYAKKAMKVSKMGLFEKLTAGVHPLTKKIIWMQISQATKETKGRRFSDDEKLIALAIMKQGPKTYKFLRRIFILPSVRTINKMIQKLKVDSGINTAIFDAIKSEVQNWPASKKYCNLIFDEVALEPGLSYDKHKDKISGFVELNTITNNYADHA